VDGTPIDQVRALWAAYARGGVDAMHAQVGEGVVEWIPTGAREPVPPEQFWGDQGRRMGERQSVTLHSLEEHGPCVIAHGSLRTFHEGGFADVQPSWVYFFRDGVLLRGAGYATREAALEAIARFREHG
jgi:hypothetical protein